jgi:uncharacterized protein (TIGR02246 family)
LKGALAKYAEAVFGTLGPDAQKAFPLMMRHLVTLGQGEEEVPNRRTVPYRDFVASGKTGQDPEAGAKGFVDLFVEKRLLVADTDPQGEVTVSVAHEALLREWQRVKEWLKENREFLRMRDRLDSSLKLWLSRGKQTDDLLEPGLHLAEGEKLLKDFGPSLSREQTDYIYASIAERNRRRQARARIRYAVMAAISVLAIIAGFQWLQAERQRQSAEKNAALARAEEARTKQALASLGMDNNNTLPAFANSQQKAGQQTNTSDQQLREQIVPFTKKDVDAWNNNDAAALAALYTEDAIKVTPLGPIRGRQAIEKWLAELFKTWHPKNFITKIHSLGIIGTADNIAENGEYSLTLQGKNGEPIPLKGYWSVILVREGEDWKLLVDANNVAPAATPSPATTPSNK